MKAHNTVSPDIFVALNETEQELQSRFQSVMLFQERKLTIGRYEFEKILAQRDITLPQPGKDQIFNDLHKLK